MDEGILLQGLVRANLRGAQQLNVLLLPIS